MVSALDSEASGLGLSPGGGHYGRNPFNQNFRAEVRKFLDVEWIATGPKRSRSIPLRAKRVSR